MGANNALTRDALFIDISELVCLIGENPGEMVRCNRIRAMFASRACRKSVMIGDPLNRQQMTKVRVRKDESM